MNQQPDIAAQHISDGLAQLQALLENSVANNALELGKNAAAKQHFDLLRRLSKSLLQYLQRDGILFYVGFLGHFSAGKSSTINSLLSAWNGEQERKTSQNPTDTTITLITQQKNAASLHGVIEEGHVPIRLEAVENPLLGNIVLVDTPGTGDPQLIEEIARDFLPICDVIFFVFSAASPLDKSDVPLLAELHKRLPFIPIHFVVTRADEFRVRSNEPLADANFDVHKADHFLQEVITRIDKILAPQKHRVDSFTLIDNRSSFHVAELTSFLRLRCDTSSTHVHVAMHLNKLHFFLKSARELQLFFASVLDTKLAELNKIVSSAAKNIAKYQEIVQISNSNLTKMWLDSAANISAASSSAIDTLRTHLPLPEKVGDFPLVTKRRNELLADIARDAKYNARSVASAIRSQVNAILTDHFYKLKKQMSESTVPDITTARYAAAPIPVAITLDQNEMISAGSLLQKVKELREAEEHALVSASTDIRRSIKTLEEMIGKRIPLWRIEEVVEAAAESLRTDLARFFQNVELYRSGVFSHNTKESIATLGIGERLDDLESEFTEEDREMFASDALEDLFPDLQDLTATSSNEYIRLSLLVAPLVGSTRETKVGGPEDTRTEIQELLDREKTHLENDLQQRLQAEVDRFSTNVNLRLAGAIVEAKTAYDAKQEHMSSLRKKRFGLAAVVTAITWLSGSWLYHRFRLPAPTSTGGQVALSIGCGLIVEAIVLFAVHVRADLPTLLKRANEHVQTSLNEQVRTIIQDALTSVRFEATEENSLTTRLNTSFRQSLYLGTDAWVARATAYLDWVKDSQRRYSELREDLVRLVDQIRMGGLRYFSDATRNATTLSAVAGRIKERAIEPSFQLLETTKNELLAVKTEVTAVKFD